MWHTTFIAVHAAAGTLAFVCGCVALTRRRMFPAYRWSLWAMEAFLVLAIASEWAVHGTAARLLFAALAGLGAFTVWRAERARRVLPAASTRPSAPYVEHIGFTLVALADGFIVVTVLNAGAPGWLVAAVGVGVAVAGHFVLGVTRTRLVPG